VGTTEPAFVTELVQLKAKEGEAGDTNRFKARDEMYEAAIDIVVREGRGSVSLLQRSLGIGYGRAARLIDFMAEDGIVGPYNGSQAREVLVTLEQWAEMSGQNAAAEIPAPPAPKRPHRIRPDDEGAEFDDAAPQPFDVGHDEASESEIDDEFESDD